MTTLVTALYAEGSTDHRFLPLLIQRTAVQILSRRGRSIIDVLEPMQVMPATKAVRAEEKILAVARQVHGYHFLFIHADADAPTVEMALQQRVEPGLALIHKAQQQRERICADVVPIIPIQMTEAWMLADANALIEVIGIASPSRLDFPKPQQVEAIADPKEQLTQIVEAAFANRTRRVRRRYRIAEFYEPLGRTVNLSVLWQVPSYQRFVADLTQALLTLNFIQ